MDLVKCCTRCNKGIYTSWRTLDDKKYYHPHCFTCVDCGVILESVPESGVAAVTAQEIYCRRCYNDRICVHKKDRQRKPENCGLQTAASTVVQETSDYGGYCSNTKKLLADDNTTNVNILFSSPSPFILHDEKCRQEYEESYSGIIESVKKQIKTKTYKKNELLETKSSVLKKKKTKSSPSTVVMDQPSLNICTKNETLERKGSRIPRPASAQSKKSLIAGTASGKVKPENGRMEKIKNSVPKLPTCPRNQNTMPSKMQRSMSLVQTRNTGSIRATERDGCSTANASIKSARSTSLRPFSALTSTREEHTLRGNHQQKGDNQCAKTFCSKRQCAAAFSGTKRKKEKQHDELNNEYLAHFSNISQLNVNGGNGGIPSTQAILTAIRKKASVGIPVSVLSSSSGIKLTNTDSYSILNPVRNRTGSPTTRCVSPIINAPQLPKRSYNMTFECPICISSLVPGCSNNEKYSDINRNSCYNVVTPCGHLFHGKCMDNWLQIKGNKRCPICSAICLPETLQPVYLECNLCADVNPKKMRTTVESSGSGIGIDDVAKASFRTLRSEYELLKAKYSAILAENHNYSLNVSLANSLQSAYDMECRNRLQLQWENRKLLMRIEELKNSKSYIVDG